MKKAAAVKTRTTGTLMGTLLLLVGDRIDLIDLRVGRE
jgi:hypothetical protein